MPSATPLARPPTQAATASETADAPTETEAVQNLHTESPSLQRTQPRGALESCSIQTKQRESARLQKQLDHSPSVGVPNAAKLNDPNHPWNLNDPWRRQPATPRQVAYLTYMGVSDADQLSKKEASDLIETRPFLLEAKSLAERNRLSSRQDEWHKMRLILYPDAYALEVKAYLRDEMPRSLHAFVRKQMVGASEILTKRKIQNIMEDLSGEDAFWWHRSNHKDVFLGRLRKMYPGCCDGRWSLS